MRSLLPWVLLLATSTGSHATTSGDWWWQLPSPSSLRQECEALADRLDDQPPTTLGPALAQLHSAIAQSQWLAESHPGASWREAGAACDLFLSLTWDRLATTQATDLANPLVAARHQRNTVASTISDARRELNSATRRYQQQLSQLNQLPIASADGCPALTPAPTPADAVSSYLASTAPHHCRDDLQQRWQLRGTRVGGAALTELLHARQQWAEANGYPSWRDYRNSQALLNAADADRWLLGLARANAPCLMTSPATNVPPPQPSSAALSALLTTIEQRLAVHFSQQQIAVWHPQVLAFRVDWQLRDGPVWLILDLLSRPDKSVRRLRQQPLRWQADGEVDAVAVIASLPQQSWSADEQIAVGGAIVQALMGHTSTPVAADVATLWQAIGEGWQADRLTLPYPPLNGKELHHRLLAAAVSSRSHRLPLMSDGGRELFAQVSHTLYGPPLTDSDPAPLWASPTLLAEDSLAYAGLWQSWLARLIIDHGAVQSLQDERIEANAEGRATLNRLLGNERDDSLIETTAGRARRQLGEICAPR